MPAKNNPTLPKRNTVFLLLALAGAALVLVWSFYSPDLMPGLTNTNDQSITEVKLAGGSISAEIADQPAERFQGLSGRSQLAEKAGMLFVFAEPQTPEFVMRDMNFAIDIIWISAEKKIVDIDHNLAPDTYPETFRPSSPAQYVLEVPAGFSKQHGVSTGDAVEFELN